MRNVVYLIVFTTFGTLTLWQNPLDVLLYFSAALWYMLAVAYLIRIINDAYSEKHPSERKSYDV